MSDFSFAPQIRSAHAGDGATILAIGRTSPWNKDAYLLRQIGAENVRVATILDATAGFVVWNREFFSLPCIWLLVVAPQHRRRGIATALLGDVERATLGERLFTSTNQSNCVMIATFAKRGYVRCGAMEIDDGDPEIFFERPRRDRPASGNTPPAVNRNGPL